LLSDCGVVDAAFTQKGSRHCYSLFGIVGGLADAPLIALADVTRNDISRRTLESGDSPRIPLLNIGARQRLRLLANGVAGCESLEAGDDAFQLTHRNSSSVTSYKMGAMTTRRELLL